MSAAHLQSLIRDVPDFPKPGILFKDITPLLGDAKGFGLAIERMSALVQPFAPEGLVAIESRGFLFGAALAQALKLPLLPVRKPGKLPAKTVSMSYQLEYGSDRVEMHADAVQKTKRYVIVDDVIATGGTAEAAARLVESQGGKVAGLAFLIELSFLKGRERLGSHAVASVLRY